MIKIWRSPYSEFGISSKNASEFQDETITAEAVYDDDTLAAIANSGFNAIWVHGLLHHLIPADEFPEFGKNSSAHIQKLTALIDRAANHGIKVFLYMQPPRAIYTDDTAFWQNHFDVAGHVVKVEADDSATVDELRSICTSTRKVQNYLQNAAKNLAKALPELGGIILITASEYPAHCVSKGGKTIGPMGEEIFIRTNCPRCVERDPVDIVAELITLLRNGMRQVSKDMKIVAWNWSWTFYTEAPCEEIIEKLPEDVIVMGGFERGGEKQILGRDTVIDEYSLSFAGPSKQFKETLKVTAAHNQRYMAKLQIGTTHELATVPNLPLIESLFQKASFIKQNNIAGFMGCWNFGNMISVNSSAFNYFLSPEAPQNQDKALTAFAAKYFPGCDPQMAAKSWKAFSEAMDSYPFSIPYLYAGPTNYALSFVTRPEKLDGKTAGRSWLNDERGDDLSAAIKPYSLDEIINGFKIVSEKWLAACKSFSEALTGCNDSHAREELGVAYTCGACFRSTYNLFSIYKLRLDWSEEKLEQYAFYIQDELKNLKDVLPYLAADKRLGFHSEAHSYFFDASSVEAKVTALESQLKEIS